MSELEPLTPLQRDVLAFMERFIDERRFPPRQADYCEHFGWRFLSTASFHLQALRRKGYIDYSKWKPRTLRILCGSENARVKRDDEEALANDE